MGVLYLKTPIGILKICSDGQAITEISSCETAGESRGDSLTGQAAGELTAYFDGKQTQFSLLLSPKGTDFQRAVWAALEKIPFGSTVTYGELAKRIGRPKACRAVGTAVGKNPVLIVIPCHRVLAADGIGGFSAGLHKKKILLAQEGIF